jgi:hypothetical protein
MRLPMVALTALAVPALQACILVDVGDGGWGRDGWRDDDFGDCIECGDDRDGDGLSDDDEDRCGTEPDVADTDGDGVGDADEDNDGDGASNGDECDGGTDPNDPDVWGDGADDGNRVCWSVGDQLALGRTCSLTSENVTIDALPATGCADGVIGAVTIDCTGRDEPPPPPPPSDRDEDGISDDDEAVRGTDPDDDDSDDDGQCDGAEVSCGSSPLDPFFTCT